MESECWRATHQAGLDPYAGYLHQNKLGKPAFICDLIEPFRYIADRVVLHLHDKNQLKKEDYTTIFRRHCRLEPPLTTLVIDKMNKALYKPIAYKGQEMMARTAIQRKIWQIKGLVKLNNC